jgi:hypothetical protein
MARFTTASKALRGPFKRLVHHLEITLRKPAIKTLDAVGRKVAAYCGAKDAETALKAAQSEAARLRCVERKPPNAISAAVDRRTGRVVAVGHSNHTTVVPAELLARLPDPPLEKKWAVTNCGEVDVASQAMAAGSKLEDLVIRTVHARDGSIFPACDNCAHWVQGEG